MAMDIASKIRGIELREVAFHQPRGLSSIDVYREQSVDTDLRILTLGSKRLITLNTESMTRRRL